MKMQDGAAQYVHPLFNSGGADVVVKSSDGVTFLLHSKNLRVHTGDTLGDASKQSEKSCLPEPSETLAIVFQFIYPQKQPNLDEVRDFGSILAIAEAVAKYKMFAAMNVCEMRLRDFLPDHATDIFAYAVKHRLEDLINEAALLFSRRPLCERLEMLPQECFMPWVKYQQAWSNVFNRVQNHIKSALNVRSIYNCDIGSNVFNCCQSCQHYLTVWALMLEKTTSFSELKNSIDNVSMAFPKILNNLNLEWVDVATKLCTNCTNGKCRNVSFVAKFIKEQMDAVPPFVSFLKDAKGKWII